jgi:CMP-N,N'-diacetyllegionaminic acid synthase
MMIGGKKVLGLIPARGGSKGLPGKNIMPIAGKPLIAWSVEQARASRYIDDVVVSTDSKEIADVAIVAGARTPFRRPDALATDKASSVDVVLHALDELAGEGSNFDIVVLLEPTSPLREANDIDGALERLVSVAGAECIVGVAAVESVHPAFLFRADDKEFLSPYAGRAPNAVRRQDLEALYFIEGSVYASFVNALRERRAFYHERTIGWPVARYKSLEIDELPDLIASEALLLARQEGRLTP